MAANAVFDPFAGLASAADVTARQVRLKSATTSKTTSVLSVDTDFTISIATPGQYRVEGALIFNCASNTPDAKVQFDFTGTSTANTTIALIVPATASNSPINQVSTQGFSLAAPISFGVIAIRQYNIVDGFLIVNTAGDFTVSWAQDATNATPTFLQLGSWIAISRMQNSGLPL